MHFPTCLQARTIFTLCFERLSRWRFDLNFRKFLLGFFGHQKGPSEKTVESVDPPHHQSAVDAWLDPSEDVTPHPLGWLGGTTLLPDNRPEIHRCQLCDIDCSQLPADVWGGLGPRQGRLVFFLTLKDYIGAEVVFIDDPAIAAPRPTQAPKEISCYFIEQNDFRDFMPALPAWPICQRGNQDSAETEDTSYENPFNDLSLADDRLKPQTLEQLRLLVEVADHKLTESHNAQMLQLESAKSATGDNTELRSVLERKIAEYERLITYFSEHYGAKPFSSANWIDAYDELKQLFRLDVDESLAIGEPFIRITGYQDVFSLTTLASRSDNKAINEACEALRDLTIATTKVLEERFSDVPTWAGSTPNYGAYRKFRAERPEQWAAFAKSIHQVQEEYTRLCFALFGIIAKIVAGPGHDSHAATAYFHVGLGKPPKNLEHAIYNLTERAKRARSALEELDDATERKSKRASTQMAVETLSGALQTTAKLKKQLKTATAHDFAQGTWDHVVAWLVGLIEDNILQKYMLGPYVTLRNLMMQQTYRDAPESIDPDTKILLRELWQRQARIGPIQIGGIPKGYCKNVANNQSVLLIQVQTNFLAGLMFGDASSVAISIDRNLLAKNDFSQLRLDISNERF
ncbi:MAG: hypothetical protein AB8B71_08465, partial [Paracoccaceae bacterium]